MLSDVRQAFRVAKLRAEIAYFTTVPGSDHERKAAKKMLRLRQRLWPDVKSRFDRVLSTLDASSLCLDLGANAGVVTQQLAATGAQVHAFEPDPHAFAMLRDAVGDAPNVTLHNAAVAAEDGHLTLSRAGQFHEDPDRFTVGTGAFRSALNDPGGESFEVHAVSLERFLHDLKRPVDLIKMDIEGAEVEILEKMLASGTIHDVKSMFVETHEAQMPELRERTIAVRQKLSGMNHPGICLDWH